MAQVIAGTEAPHYIGLMHVATRGSVLLLLLAGAAVGTAQDTIPVMNGRVNGGFDSTYVLDLTHMLTGRVYLSTKSNAFSIIDGETRNTLIYRPNNQVNLGIGASYRALTLNIGIGFGFLNPDDPEQGNTNYLDAQLNYFSRRFASNIFFQVYRGYYITQYTSQELGWNTPSTRPFREDVLQANAGLSSLYIFNNQRFSYRAAFNQDAWQRRSAGSFLAGGYMTFYTTEADSSLMPTALRDRFDPQLDFNSGSFLDLGVMAGYAHTFVYKQHWFFTLSTAFGAGISGYDTQPSPNEERPRKERVHAGYHVQARSALGYNSQLNCVALSFNGEAILHSMGDQERFGWTVGNLRLNVAHRFKTGVKPMDHIIRGLAP